MTWRRPSPGLARPPARFDRTANLARLGSESFDVVVVGGGVTGCGVALDAAARGLRTALVEADDFASGTSSRSSKMVHGGLRYLQHREFRLVYDALAERQRLLRNAPHLVRPLPFLIPLFGRDGVVSAGAAKAYSTALWLYDLTGGLRIGRRHRRISAAEALRHVPGLRTDRLVASFLYWDAQADDARLTLSLARTAAASGAVVVNHAPVKALIRRSDGRLRGVRLADGIEVDAGVVVNAGGVWSGEIADLDPGAGADRVRLRPAKGVHLTIPAERLPCDTAVVLPVPGEHRTVFVVPWEAAGAEIGGRGRWTYVGTTDTDYEGSLREPRCSGDDIDSLLDVVNAWMTTRLTPADVSASWAGLRPLVDDEHDAKTADLSRRHRVTVSASGLVTVTGGKLTTYRRMASDAVDRVVSLMGPERRPSPTRRLRLVGAGGRAELRSSRAQGREVMADPSVRDHLLGRYGLEAAAVAALAETSPELGEPLVPGLPYLKAEAVFAVRHEMAGSLTDVLARRTRAAILDRPASVGAAPDVARLIGAELGWSAEQIEAEVATFTRAAAADDVAAEQRAAPPSQPADAT